MGQRRGIAWAIRDILTTANFEVAAITALIGYILFEFLRTRFWANVAPILGVGRPFFFVLTTTKVAAPSVAVFDGWDSC